MGPMAKVSLAATSLAVSALVFAACGARTGLPTGADVCTGVPVGQVRQRPNLYFILDRSKSMREGTPAKWGVIRNDVSELITQLGSEAEFGAAWFPPGDEAIVGECAAGEEIMPLRPGDGLPASQSGSTAAAFMTATNRVPLGGTPTAETFVKLTPKLSSLPGHTFAILATDGGPNCNAALSCGKSACTLNIDQRDGCSPEKGNCCAPGATGGPIDCLDGARTVAAVRALAKAGVPTFAIGVPGSEAYSDILVQIAKAGGTDHYYPVNTASSSSLVDALANIAARIAASCKLELQHAPPAEQTNVVVNGNLVPQTGTNGWTASGNFVTLFGATCDEVQSQGDSVVVTEGCPTLL